jgi:drug/metabolite transporter (DMT)-like permease
MERRRAWLDWSVLVALVIVWGSAFAGLKIAVAGLPPPWVASTRLGVAALTLLLIMQLRREPLGFRGGSAAAWPTYMGIGVFGLGLPFLLFSWAATELPSAVLAICNGVSPVFTAIFAHAFLAGERLNKRKTVGVGLGMVGFIALVAPDLQGGLGAAGAAEFVALAGAALYAVANVVTKKAPPASSVTSAFHMCLAGALATGVAAMIWAGPPGLPDARTATAIVALGVAPTALGTIGYVWLIRRRGALFTSFTTYLSPVWAVLLGVALLGERPGWAEYLALALILIGVGIANLRNKTIDRPPSPRAQPG